MRSPDERWLPALAKAEALGVSLSEVIDGYLARYVAEPIPATHAFTLANWPEAAEWANGRVKALGDLHGELAPSVGGSRALPREWLTVAAWLASTHHAADRVQQRRVITGHVLRRLMADPDGPWRDRYRDSRLLSEAVQAILARHLPLGED